MEADQTMEQAGGPAGIVRGDSLELIQAAPAESVHLVLRDLSYGIGADHWDVLHHNTNAAYLGHRPAQRLAGAVFQRRRRSRVRGPSAQWQGWRGGELGL
ncbi:MAG: hypothetical protein TH68_08280, partial [Candidatus Synechococcus spongiarum 142]